MSTPDAGPPPSRGGDDPPPELARLPDALDFGVLLLDADGRLRWANRPSREALEAGDPLRLEADRLALDGKEPQRRLLRALAEAAAGSARILRLDGAGSTARLGLSPWGSGPAGEALVLGTLRSEAHRVPPALRVYAREWKLTPGETDVMRGLMLGERPPEIAARRGSSQGTVRSQIKTLLAKTGTHSMRDLVVEALHLPPMPSGAPAVPSPPQPDGGARRPVPGDGGPLRAVAALGASRRPAVIDPAPARPEPDAARRSLRRGASRPRRPIPAVPDREALLALRAACFAWPPAA
jgi:DNA-binding CsgD family transcriptional regulator